MPEPSEILRVGVAGYGSTGQIRRKHIDAHPRMQTVAVCDRTIATPGETSSDGVRTWSDWEQLLEEDLDVLFVCLWNDIAPTVVMEGLKRGSARVLREAAGAHRARTSSESARSSRPTPI